MVKDYEHLSAKAVRNNFEIDSNTFVLTLWFGTVRF